MRFPVILAASLFCVAAGGAHAQPAPAAPPRTISDITAILDQQKPDPARVARARAEAEKQPPAGLTDAELSWFHVQRARALGTLGRTQAQIADLRAAIAIGKRSTTVDIGPALQDLAQITQIMGNTREAHELHLERMRTNPDSSRGRLFNIYAQISRTAAQMGDFAKARDFAGRAERLLADGGMSRAPIYHTIIDDWRAQIARAKAFVAETEGRWAEAEKLTREAVTFNERMIAKGQDNLARFGMRVEPYFNLGANIAYDLASQLQAQNRLSEAESEARRGLLQALRLGDKYTPVVSRGVGALTATLMAQGRYAEAQRLAEAGIEIARGAGSEERSPTMIRAMSAFAGTLMGQGKAEEAVAVHERINGWIRDAGADGTFIAPRGGTISYANALLQVGRAAEAIPLLAGAVQRMLSRYGEKDYDTAEMRGLLAAALTRAGDLPRAAAEFKIAMPILLQASRQTDSEEGGSQRDLRMTRISEGYMTLLAQARGTPLEQQLGVDAVAESFRLGDAARGQSVQRALAASSARAAASDPKLADLARAEQDAQKQVSAQFTLLNSILASPPEQQDAGAIRDLRKAIDTLRDQRAKARAQIEREFPAYADLVDPRPATLERARQVLRPGEALITTFVGRDATFVWAVSHGGASAYAVVPLGRAQIARRVAQVRQSLDPNAATLEEIPAFDVAAAHRLYADLLAPVEAGWKGAKSLLVVADRQLGQLPFGLLVTAPAEVPTAGPLFAGYRNVPFLIRQAAITQVPSVAALAALRALSAAPASRQPFIGFGDPWFSREQAGEARTQQTAALQTRGRPLVRRNAPATQSMDSAELGLLPRLPDTADEVRSIALALGADPVRDVILGAQANERTVRTADLSNRRIVMFATHGLIPGDLNGLTQPALALSAPSVADVDGDGLLTMDEVLGLKLNADWVVLSACNTAAGDGAGAEAVSGLGRAFFYAGTRALLVSNWPVETTSARLLTTDLFARQAADPALPRAVAMQQAMLGLIDGPGVQEGGKTVFSYAHPIFWAPFSVVGDGG